MSALKTYKLYKATTFLEIYITPVLVHGPLFIYLINLTGQKQYVTEQK